MRTSPAVLLCALGLLFGCRAPEFANAVAHPAVVAPTAAELRHEFSSMRVSVQDGSGRVWGMRWSDGKGVYHWTEDGWRKVEDANEWPGTVVDLAADPSDPNAVVSLWAGRPNTGSDFSVVHLRRHRAGAPSVPLASFPNPSIGYVSHMGERPRLALGPGGEAWVTSPAPAVVRIPPGGGEPSVIRPDTRLFRSSEGERITSYHDLAFLPTGPGEGWWWTLGEEHRMQQGGGELVRPARVRAGRIEPCPDIAGLPASGRVTLVAPRAGGRRTVWAIESEGLWEVDSGALTAKSIASPPGAWRIIDWAEPAAGLETALVVAEKKDAARRVGDIWLGKNGDWSNAGASGDVQTRSDRLDGDQLRSRSWLVDGTTLLAGGFNEGLPMIDLAEPEPRVRVLGWAERQSVKLPARLHRLPDGSVLAVGVGTLRASPGALHRAAEYAGTKPTRVFAFTESAARAPDGRLWVSRVDSRRVAPPEVRHWDGNTWHCWSMPSEQDRWPDKTLWVDERGRVALFSDELDKPAWERDESMASGWRAWADGRALVAARAAEAPPAAALVRFNERYHYTPVFSCDGRALVARPERSQLWYYAGGTWTVFEQGQVGTSPKYYGFEPGEGGAPWYQNGSSRRRLTNGRWVEVPAVREIEEDYEPPQSALPERPEWLNKLRSGRNFGPLHADADGVWWGLADNELWKLRDGEAAQVFATDEPSPYCVGMGGKLKAVHVDAKGNRFFLGSPNVLLLAGRGPIPVITPLSADSPFDRVFTVRGDDLLRYEWRVNGGAWRRGETERLVLRELAAGKTELEVRAINRRLDVGPIARVEQRLDYDEAARTAKLIARCRSSDSATRSDAIRRLAKRGSAAEAALRKELEQETDAESRWWLHAALQAIEDMRRHDNILTTP